MGISEPEPEKKLDERDYDLKRDDVLEMADGLTGSHSAILGNAYDHNASFTNQGEISTAGPVSVPQSAAEEPVVQLSPEEMPDPDAPVATGTVSAPEPAITEPAVSEPTLPEIPVPQQMSDEPILPEIPMPEQVMEEPAEPVMMEIPEGPVIEHDGNLDIIPEPVLNEMPVFADSIPVPTFPVQEPVAESVMEPIAEPENEPVMEAVAEPVIEPVMEPVAEEPAAPSISIDDLDPNDGAKALDADMISALFESANAADAEPAAEEPIAEPIMEEATPEPVMEPIAEPEAEPAMEEPAAEEPAAPSISIDDLDPNDGAKALDADMISALFESANAADAEPAAEEPIAEPIMEEATPEPVMEPIAEPEAEPAMEEPAAEEPAAEEPAAPSISIDDLDPNDNAKALDADMIAALFESANAADAETAAEESASEPAADEPLPEEMAAEEPAADETISEEPAGDADFSADGLDAALEEIDIPMGDEEESPLMPDQEISDLLSSLGELSGENADEEPESIAEAEASAEAGAKEGASDTDIGGIDMFDTDLSAMLDDVTGSLAEEGGGSGADDADLNDLLGSLDDGSGDLSDIGDLLNKDENSELVDPNTETAEALFASDSEEDLFGIDNLIDEEENTKGKKKKGFLGGLFGKKKKKDEGNIEIIGGDEEILIDPDLLDIPDEADLKKKKGSFFANLFAKLFEEDEEETEGGIQGEQSAVDIAAEGAAENEAILNELDNEAAAEKKGKKEKKKKEKKKKDKKGGASEDEEGEEAAEEKKKPKKEKKKKEKVKLPDLPTKKLPRKKVVAIALFCITIGLVVTFLAFLLPYSQDIKKAKKFYTTGEYQKTYEYMRGHKLTSDDQILYDRTVTLLRIKRPYDSYLNYMKMGLRMEALNALVQGVQMVDRYAEDAASLGIIDKYSKQSRIIYDELYNTFGVTVDKARSWIEIEGTPEYTRALYECLLNSSNGGGGTAVMPEDNYDMMPQDDSVIGVEESNL